MSKIPVLRRPLRAAALVGLAALLLSAPASRAEYLHGNFEDQYPGPDSYRNDFGPAGQFQTGEFTLSNHYEIQEFGDFQYEFWHGFAVSSRVDNTYEPTDPSFIHQFGAYAPARGGLTGSGGSATYATAFVSNFGDDKTFINRPENADWVSIDVANTTYAAQSILLGDGFARAFEPGDWFRLDILGYSDLGGAGSLIDTISFYLADYRGDTLQLISDWTRVDLGNLAGARSLAFELFSSDVDEWGMNTPASFAIDNLIAFREGPDPSIPAVPEPSSLLLAGLGLGGLAFYQRRSRRV